MEHLDFLKEEFRSVKAALSETLRHDYGPSKRSEAYFEECTRRLDFIGSQIDDVALEDGGTIASLLNSLSALGSRICLIERSHLGEFSWPFASAIQDIAEKLFVKPMLKDKQPNKPIVHVIAESMHYQIVDDVQASYGPRRIMIVAFPRQLKHHVLLHSLFGHELAHIAARTPKTVDLIDPGHLISVDVMAEFEKGPLHDGVQATDWFKRDDAPEQVNAVIADDPSFKFLETSLSNWRTEIVCDLFGLMLFGPSFAAAHRMILEPVSADPNRLVSDKSTHPPFVVRRRAVTRAMKLLAWDKPVCNPDQGAVYEAESEFLSYATEDSSSTWPDVLSQDQLQRVLDVLRKIVKPYPSVAFSRPEAGQLAVLVDRLTLCRPPIVQQIDANGIPTVEDVKTFHCLYAGWSFWFGREKLRNARLAEYPRLQELDFLKVNKLCDQALLQQRAIAHSKGLPL